MARRARRGSGRVQVAVRLPNFEFGGTQDVQSTSGSIGLLNSAELPRQAADFCRWLLDMRLGPFQGRVWAHKDAWFFFAD